MYVKLIIFYNIKYLMKHSFSGIAASYRIFLRNLNHSNENEDFVIMIIVIIIVIILVAPLDGGF